MPTGALVVGGEERRVQRDVADVAAGDVEPRELRVVECRRPASPAGTRARQIAARCAAIGEREVHDEAHPAQERRVERRLAWLVVRMASPR